MSVTIKVEGLDVILKRFTKYQSVANRELRTTMKESLNVIQEKVPPYPSRPPTSKYVRTGTLGRSLGSGGEPDIKRIIGSSTMLTGEFGTRLKYAPYVVGENQAWMHKGRWWRLPVEVLNRAVPKITELWNATARNLAAYLNGKGM